MVPTLSLIETSAGETVDFSVWAKIMQMIKIVTKYNTSHHLKSLEAMHRLRKTVFKDRLGWDVAVRDDAEIDAFDHLLPIYIMSVGADDTLLGFVRLLPTTGPNMLRDVFPSLVRDAAVPSGEAIWEASRFAIAPCLPRLTPGLSGTTYELLAGVLAFSLQNSISTIVCVVDLRMERILQIAGWPLQRLGEPHRIGRTAAVAGQLEVTSPLLLKMKERAECREGRSQVCRDGSMLPSRPHWGSERRSYAICRPQCSLDPAV